MAMAEGGRVSASKRIRVDPNIDIKENNGEEIEKSMSFHIHIFCIKNKRKCKDRFFIYKKIKKEYE